MPVDDTPTSLSPTLASLPANFENIDCTPTVAVQLDHLGCFAQLQNDSQDGFHPSDFLYKRSDFAGLHSSTGDDEDFPMTNADTDGFPDELWQLFFDANAIELQREIERARNECDRAKDDLVKEKEKARQFREEIGDEFSCSICHDLIVYPHLLKGCGHVFCGECLLKWLVDMKKNVCPECRSKVVNRAKAMCPEFKLTSAVQAFVNRTLGEDEKADYANRQRIWQSSKSRKPTAEKRERRVTTTPTTTTTTTQQPTTTPPRRGTDTLVPAVAAPATPTADQITRNLQDLNEWQQQMLQQPMSLVQQPLPSLNAIISQPAQHSLELPPLQAILPSSQYLTFFPLVNHLSIP